MSDRCLALTALMLSIAQTFADNAEFLLRTEKLPDDLSFLPTLGNGHLGYTVFGDAIFMNGIYNGRAGDSRRARLPNWLNLSVVSVEGLGGSMPITPLEYELNLEAGYFRWSHAATSSSGQQLQLEQRTYAHRYYNRALVYELLVQRSMAAERLQVKLRQVPGAPSEAFDFFPVPEPRDVRRWPTAPRVLRGVTRTTEHLYLQPQRKTVYIYFSDNWADEKTIEMVEGQFKLCYRFVITADTEQNVARNEMLEIEHNFDDMLRKHVEEWKTFWQDFRIEVQGNLKLSRTINAGLFYMASSLPSHHSRWPTFAYFGLSPTGLGRGQLDADYQGHNFWDTEIWMLPPVTQLSTQWADALLQYRFRHLEGARYNANITGYEGARFPWESAYTGSEVTNPCCPEVAAQEVHISPDIAFALQQLYTITRDQEWLCTVAWPLLRDIAAFLQSRVEFSAKSAKYHIKVVMGPDEDHWNVTDNVYTNVVFKLALEFASFVRQQCTISRDSQNDSWLHIAERLEIVYDSALNYHPQHLGYQRGEEVKQADVILLGYPLQYPMNASTRSNDLNAYEHVTRASGPAMTWSMFAINFLDVGELEKANFYFEKGYEDYVRPEFKVWSETKIGYTGSVNFLTGVGGFLQAIINGYGGIRFQHSNQAATMKIGKRHLLPTSSAFTIKGIKFAQSQFTLEIKSNASATLTCTKMGKICLQLLMGAKTFQVFNGFELKLGDAEVVIQTV